MKTNTLIYFLLTMFFAPCMACEKNVQSEEIEKTSVHLTGTIYFHFAGRYGSLDLNKNLYVNEFAKKKDFGKIDISKNGKKILLVTTKGISGTDHQRIIYRNLSTQITFENLTNGGNIYDFKYQWRNIGIGSGTQCYISPNEKYIAINAESSGNHSITIINSDRDETIEKFRDENISLRNHKIVGWTSDNSLIINVDGNIFKVNESTSWEPQSLLRVPSNHVSVNPQGTKIVFRAEKHLFMCNIDGNDIRQITNSKTIESIQEDGERLPVFSPDGKYIAFSTKATGAAASWENPIDGSIVGTASSYGYLAIIPADGKLYQLDSVDSNVIYPRSSGNKLIAVDGEFFWK